MKMQLKRAVQALTSRGWLAHQTPEFQASILSCLRWEHFEPKQNVYVIGDRPGGIYGIVGGALGVTIAPGVTGLHLAHIATQGTWLGEAAYLTGQPRRVGLEAITECEIAHLPLAEMERMSVLNPNAARIFGQIAVLNIDLALRAIEDLLIPDTSRRIAAVIWRATNGTPGRRMHATQAQLGLVANASRKGVLAGLRELVAIGAIHQRYGAVEVLDSTLLRRFTDATDADHRVS